MSKKVVIGISGGIDSSMAAVLLKQQGYDVIGLHFSFNNEKYADKVNEISSKLNIPVIVEDISIDFEKVKKHFASEYLKGRTPSPCTFCNRVIKWQKLIEFADKNNCQYISSGHYIRKTQYNGSFHLQKGADPVKDQSYFLWELGPDIINRMITPLGDLTKKQIKQFAVEKGFTELSKIKESMGVCFLKGQDYRDFLKDFIPNEIKKIEPGNVRDIKGNIIGTHSGYVYYTVGQKRGLNLKTNSSAYVLQINPTLNELIVGKKEDLLHHYIRIKELHFINSDNITEGLKVTVNIRGLGLNPLELATIKSIHNNSIEIELTSPAWAVAPGQPVVFYDNDIVLGGGIAENSW